jgi:pilus assembly protein Flp/PilA
MTKLRNVLTLGLMTAVQGFSLESLQREEGQTLAEYALILALIAAVVVGVVVILGGNIKGLFSSVASSI